jgi:peptidoglycan hydrolase CwlO-like protein
MVLQKQKRKRRIKPTQRFMAMSKRIGIFIAIILIIIVGYAMYEMHHQNDLNSLPQLLISTFGIGAVYIGFYLTMAKWEHIEAEKTNRQKDLLKLKKQLESYNKEQQLCEDIENCNKDIEDFDSKLNELETQDFTNNCY